MDLECVRAKVFNRDNVQDVLPCKSSTSAVVDWLPLIITQKMDVSFWGTSFRIEQEGLYKFAHLSTTRPEKQEAANLIYYEKDDFSLLAALGRLHLHGAGNPGMKMRAVEIVRLIKKGGRFSTTCGGISGIAKDLLSPLGLKLRRVQFLTLDEWNAWDNGHICLEYFYPAEQRWILADLDSRCLFVDEHNRYLDTYGLSDAVNHRKAYRFEMLCSTDGFNHLPELNGEFDFYGFWGEGMAVEAVKRRWFARIAQVPAIEADGLCYFPIENAEQQKRAESYQSPFKGLPKDEWFRRFYGKTA